MNDWPGRTTGNDRIAATLGTGGMGRVLRAVDVHINRVAAIKALHEQIAIDPAWSPDGSQLACLSEDDGNDANLTWFAPIEVAR